MESIKATTNNLTENPDYGEGPSIPEPYMKITSKRVGVCGFHSQVSKLLLVFGAEKQ